MHHFTQVSDVADLNKLLLAAKTIKKHPNQYQHLGQNKTLGLIFFNPSLRTRLSTQRAAQNLGLNVIVMNIGTEGWQLEFEDGTVMDQGRSEHVKDAAAVMGSYCEIIGIRAFAELQDKKTDYEERVLEAFKQYAGVPILSLESSIRHPLQSFADLITIRENTPIGKPKIVLSWAPHPKALPQAVANSFAEWMSASGLNVVITHPKGYELDPAFTRNIPIEYDQKRAFSGAHFVYAKNWSAVGDYGKVLHQDKSWTIDRRKMAVTDNAYFMHCLPVRRNVVVADEVIDSDRSLVVKQAANRVVSAQTVLKEMLEGMR